MEPVISTLDLHVVSSKDLLGLSACCFLFEDLTQWLGQMVTVVHCDKKGVKCQKLNAAGRKPQSIWLVPAALTRPLTSQQEWGCLCSQILNKGHRREIGLLCSLLAVPILLVDLRGSAKFGLLLLFFLVLWLSSRVRPLHAGFRS